LDTHLVIFQPSGRRGRVEKGKNLLEVSRELGVDIESVCGGQKTCGKCKVRVQEGFFERHGISSHPDHLSPLVDEEEKLLSDDEIAQGYRLACAAEVLGDVLLFVPEESRGGKQVVRKDVTLRKINLNPAVRTYSVKLDKPTPNPRTLKYLKVEMQDITTEDLDLTDDYQKMLSAQPIIIESTLPQLTELPVLTLPIQGQDEFLESSAYIQCTDRKIIDKAREVIGDEKIATNAVARLVAGVYNLLEKNPTASLPSALDVLEMKKGDCNEHAILFTALARAVGIPTKIYVGLVNLDGYAYYYHAWCAVWLGSWVAVDPTFNQFPADVGHLKLKEGEIAEQAVVLKVVGKLQIKMLEYSQ